LSSTAAPERRIIIIAFQFSDNFIAEMGIITGKEEKWKRKQWLTK
jgi:hypothetical protein